MCTLEGLGDGRGVGALLGLDEVFVECGRDVPMSLLSLSNASQSVETHEDAKPTDGVRAWEGTGGRQTWRALVISSLRAWRMKPARARCMNPGRMKPARAGRMKPARAGRMNSLSLNPKP